MQLKNSALIILNQIKSLVEQLKEREYNASLELLSDNSIGKHVRHVVEFFDLLVKTSENDVINYDERDHDELIESDKVVCLEKIDYLLERIELIKGDRIIDLKVSYSTDQETPISVQTSINRELAYNIEHAIHHMAIMKIAVITVFPHVKLSDSFGVAYSTIRYQKTKN